MSQVRLADVGLVGRNRELEAAIRGLRAAPPHHVLVRAGPGMGSTEFVRQLATASDRPDRMVYADPSVRRIPFGALAPLAERPLEPNAEALADATARILGDGPAPVLVVDGVEHLDGMSAVAVAHAADRGATLIATCAPGEPLPPAIRALLRRHRVAEIPLLPLDVTGVAELITSLLPGAVDPGLVSAIRRLVGGAPAAIVDTVRAGVADGAIDRPAGTWLVLAPIALPEAAAVRVDDVLSRLSRRERMALDLLTVAGSLEPQELAGLMGDAAVDALHRRRLLARDHLPRAVERVADPFVASVLDHRLTPAGRRALAGRLSAAVASSGDLVGWGAVALEVEQQPDPERLLRAADEARRRGAHALSERLRRRAWSDSRSALSAIALAESLIRGGRASEAEAVLAADSVGTPGDAALLLATRAMNLAYRLDDLDSALDLVAAAAEEHGGSRWSGELQSLRAALHLMSGRPDVALGTAQAPLGGADARSRCRAAIPAASALVTLGRPGDAVAVAMQVGRERGGMPDGSGLAGASMFDVVRAWGLAELGQFAEADRRTASALSVAGERGDRELMMWAGLLRGRSMLDQGRYVEASEAFEVAESAARDIDLPTQQRWTIGGQILAHAQAGDEAGTVRSLRALDSTPTTRLKLMEPDVIRSRAWATLVTGDREQAGRLLRESADAARAAASTGLEVLALHDLVRLGYEDVPDRLDRLDELAGVVQGPLLEARCRHGRAAAEGSVEGLAEVGREFEHLGAVVLAAEALNQAAWAARGAGRWMLADQLAVSARVAAARRPEAQTPGMGLLPGLGTLTRREREVADLAAGGASSRRIAELLGVSVRTVDNLLLRVYRKLGVSGRSELQAATRQDRTPAR